MVIDQPRGGVSGSSEQITILCDGSNSATARSSRCHKGARSVRGRQFATKVRGSKGREVVSAGDCEQFGRLELLGDLGQYGRFLTLQPNLFGRLEQRRAAGLRKMALASFEMKEPHVRGLHQAFEPIWV